MRITRIYYKGSISVGTVLKLDAAASSHLVRVLRSKINTPLILFNGLGGEYAAKLVKNNARAAELEVTQFNNIDRESLLDITLIQGISRGDRMDTTIQKVTELGVKRIMPVICERSSHMSKLHFTKKAERWRQISISACEQSGRTAIPDIHHITDIDIALKDNQADICLVLDPDGSKGLVELTGNISSLIVLSGPEGGLTDKEIEMACSFNYTRLRLGNRILRTETAGPSCIAAAQVLWGDIG